MKILSPTVRMAAVPANKNQIIINPNLASYPTGYPVYATLQDAITAGLEWDGEKTVIIYGTAVQEITSPGVIANATIITMDQSALEIQLNPSVSPASTFGFTGCAYSGALSITLLNTAADSVPVILRGAFGVVNVTNKSETYTIPTELYGNFKESTVTTDTKSGPALNISLVLASGYFPVVGWTKCNLISMDGVDIASGDISCDVAKVISASVIKTVNFTGACWYTGGHSGSKIHIEYTLDDFAKSDYTTFYDPYLLTSWLLITGSDHDISVNMVNQSAAGLTSLTGRKSVLGFDSYPTPSPIHGIRLTVTPNFDADFNTTNYPVDTGFSFLRQYDTYTAGYAEIQDCSLVFRAPSSASYHGIGFSDVYQHTGSSGDIVKLLRDCSFTKNNRIVVDLIEFDMINTDENCYIFDGGSLANTEVILTRLDCTESSTTVESYAALTTADGPIFDNGNLSIGYIDGIALSVINFDFPAIVKNSIVTIKERSADPTVKLEFDAESSNSKINILTYLDALLLGTSYPVNNLVLDCNRNAMHSITVANSQNTTIKDAIIDTAVSITADADGTSFDGCDMTGATYSDLGSNTRLLQRIVKFTSGTTNFLREDGVFADPTP